MDVSSTNKWKQKEKELAFYWLDYFLIKYGENKSFLLKKIGKNNYAKGITKRKINKERESLSYRESEWNV